MRQLIFPIFLGAAGIAVLLYLGFWQLARLEWKEDILAKLDAALNASPIALERVIDPVNTLSERNYTRVRAEVSLTGEEVHIYAPTADGLGYRIVTSALWQDRNILIDLGWVSEAHKSATRPALRLRIIGNLLVTMTLTNVSHLNLI